MNDLTQILYVLVLLGVANGTPILAKKLLKERFDRPLDGGWIFPDGQPLLGNSKTFRGVVVALACTAGAALLLGMDWRLGAGIASLSMLGDILSSFVKRRLHLKPHAQALGLDQIPEALLPLLVLKGPLNLTGSRIVTIVAVFMVLEILLSRLLYRLKIRDRPY